MNKEQVQGLADKVVGRAKRAAGTLTDDTKLEWQGAAQELKGNVESVWGKAKQAVHGVVLDLKLNIDTEAQPQVRTEPVDIHKENSK